MFAYDPKQNRSGGKPAHRLGPPVKTGGGGMGGGGLLGPPVTTKPPSPDGIANSSGGGILGPPVPTGGGGVPYLGPPLTKPGPDGIANSSGGGVTDPNTRQTPWMDGMQNNMGALRSSGNFWGDLLGQAQGQLGGKGGNPLDMLGGKLG